MTTLKFQFHTNSWSEEKEEVGGLTLARYREGLTVTGDIEGKGVGVYVMTYIGPTDAVPKDVVESGQRASFDGEMVLEATIQGKKGTFALRSTGIYTGGVENQLTIVEGSATGELAGLKGKGSALKAAGAPSNGELVVEFGSK